MLITGQEQLNEFCSKLSSTEFITVDTEFLREKTYYPLLCLIQASGPDGQAAAIDPLAGDLDLEPFIDVLKNPDVLKVFHAARQDLEIFYNVCGAIPAPIFDTQIAAMVCGFGDSVGYENLVRNILGRKLDKSVQFTDWSRRPLSQRMLDYALGDVTHLIDIYKKLSKEIEKRNRISWLKQEEAVLANPATYHVDPRESWKRVKIRSNNRLTLAALRELAAWREVEAQRRNSPRNWVMRDDVLADIAVLMPKNKESLAKARGITQDLANGKTGEKLLDLIRAARDLPKEEWPLPKARKEPLPQDLTPVLEMLRMLLRINSAEQEVVPRMVASNDELEELAVRDDAEIPAMSGWRFEVFGRDALALKHGKMSLKLENNQIKKIDLAY